MARKSKRSAAPADGSASDRFQKSKRFAIQCFLVFHLLAIACWSLPVTFQLVTQCRELIRPYFAWVGLFQTWDMFAPSPKTMNSYVEAIVLYTDGNTRNWAFPRMERLGLGERMFKERYRKYVENLKEDGNAALWPDAARFIARHNNDRPAPVRIVFLVRYWADIVPQSGGPYRASPFEAHVFYAYTVLPEDLH